MRQNTEGTYIILKFPRLQNNAHPLQNAGFKLYILVILPSERAEHCALAADVRRRDDDTRKHRARAGPCCPCTWVYRYFYSCGSQSPVSGK